MSNIHIPEGYALAQLNTVYEPMLRGFRTAGAGDVSVQREDKVNVVIPGLLAGETFKGMIRKINSEGTTVNSPTTNIVVFW
jgi:hypothetical protein